MTSPTSTSKTKTLQHSVSPAGEKFPIPHADEYVAEYQRLEQLAAQARAEGKEIVVVMGLGFVGAVMAAIVADARGADSKFVIGCQRPSLRSYWKVPVFNRGEAPLEIKKVKPG